jgi:hypothetical protein
MRLRYLPIRPYFEILEDRSVPAVMLDLSMLDASGSVDGVVFQQADPQPTGVGVINDFLRIQSNSGLEHGYNSDARPVQLDEKKDHHTRSIRLNELPRVTAGGTDYRVILLGVNQNQASPLISLDELRLYVSDARFEAGYNVSTKHLGSLSAVWELGDNWVKLNSALSSGNGSGDMFLFVPEQLLTSGVGENPFVYLYSRFGVNHEANGGFEQWAPGVGASLPANSSLSGFVYSDADRDGVFDPFEGAIPGVLLTLTGIDSFGQDVHITTETNQDGSYSFPNLLAGTYFITETQPPGFLQGINSVGTINGEVAGEDLGDDVLGNIQIHPNQFGINYNFGEFVDDVPS